MTKTQRQRVSYQAELHSVTIQRIYRLIKEKKVKAGRGGKGVDEKSLSDWFEYKRDFSKVNNKPIPDDVPDVEMEIPELESITPKSDAAFKSKKKVKNVRLETEEIKLELLKMEVGKQKREFLKRSEVDNFYDTYQGAVNGLLNEMTNSLTPKLFDLFNNSKGKNISGSIKKILSDFSFSIQNALSNGRSKLKDLGNKK